ncbi:MAG: T9SS type A sorting domain-containing protein [Bacteroidia bacterium]
MRNILRAFALAGATLSWGVALAQPTLTANGCNTQIGDVFTTYTGSYVNPGSSGANQTWDFTSLAGSPAVANTCASPSSTSQGSSFPSATVVCQSAAGDRYLEANSSALINWGAYVPASGTLIPHTDGEDFIRFPMTMGNNFTDQFSAVYTNGGYTYHRRGSVTATADGYGTLITPGGTYSNVLRLHYVEDYQDSTNFGFPFVTTIHNDEYIWYKDGYHTAIATTFQLSNNGTQIAANATYADFGAVGISAQQAPFELSLSPNPASNATSVNVELPTGTVLDLELLDIAGRSIRSIHGIALGTGNMELDLSELPSGLYLVKVTPDGMKQVVQRLQVAH